MALELSLSFEGDRKCEWKICVEWVFFFFFYNRTSFSHRGTISVKQILEMKLFLYFFTIFLKSNHNILQKDYD